MFSFRKILFLLLFLFAHSGIFAEDKIYSVLLLKDWKPYYSLDKNGKPTGYAIELFETIAKESGIQYKYELFENWQQMNSYRTSGKEYIVPNTGIDQIRADYTLFSDPTDTFVINYFKRKASHDIKNQHDLENKKIVIVKDNICEKLIHNGNIQKVFYDCYLVSLNALVSGEVDAMCYPKPLLDIAIKSLHLTEKIVSFGEPLKEIKRGFGFSHNNSHLVPIFNETLQKLKKDGRYQKIYEKWFGEEKGIKLSYEEIVLLTATLIILMIIIFFILYYTSRRKKWLLTQDELTNQVEEKTSQLQQNEQALKQAQHMARIGSWSYDLVHNKLIWSDEVFNIFELDKDTIQPSYEAFLDAIHPKDKQIVDESYQNSLKTKQPYSIQHKLLMKNGKVKWVKEECQTKFNENGEAIISTGTIQDITKDIEYQNKLNEASKLASMGEMIGNIAHQWRQPLSVITTSASGLKIKIELDGKIDNESVNDAVDSIMQQANYLSDTINNFRDFIKSDHTYTKTSIKNSIEKSLELVRAALDMNFITLKKDLCDDLEIIGSNHELEQAFINILNNSKDVLKEKIHNDEDRFIFVSSHKINDNTLEVVFKDTGGGIDEKIINRIFEPYFSTKHSSVGTGLGLTLVDKIIRQRHKAKINVYNQEFEYGGKKYKGACLSLLFDALA